MIQFLWRFVKDIYTSYPESESEIERIIENTGTNVLRRRTFFMIVHRVLYRWTMDKVGKLGNNVMIGCGYVEHSHHKSWSPGKILVVRTSVMWLCRYAWCKSTVVSIFYKYLEHILLSFLPSEDAFLLRIYCIFLCVAVSLNGRRNWIN